MEALSTSAVDVIFPVLPKIFVCGTPQTAKILRATLYQISGLLSGLLMNTGLKEVKNDKYSPKLIQNWN